MTLQSDVQICTCTSKNLNINDMYQLLNNKVTKVINFICSCNKLFLWLIPESVNNNVHTKIGLPLSVASMMVDPS